MRKRITALILILCMAFSMTFSYAPLGYAASAIESDQPFWLFAQKSDIDLSLNSPGGYAVMGTFSTTVSEYDEYIIATVYRQGQTSGDVTVELKTADISAKYGEDYIIDDPRYNTIVTPQAMTYLERSASPEAKEQTKLAQEQLQNILLTEPGSQNEEVVEKAVYEEVYEEYKLINGSLLALMREQQLGKSSRHASEIQFMPLEGQIFNTLGIDIGQEMETSSTTVIEFKEGEDTKQVMLRIIEDDKAEGDKVFDLILSNPSEGLELSPVVNCTITIKDAQPEERSIISLSEAKFESSKNSVTVKVKREGAPYSMVTVMLKTVETGDAVAGNNFQEIDAQVDFTPFIDEREVEIAVRGGGRFEVELYDFKGADKGDIVSAECVINDSIYGSQLNSTFAEPIAGNALPVNSIEINNTIYDLEEKPNTAGDTWGIIKNSAGTVVGEYIFASSDWDDSTPFEGDGATRYVEFHSTLNEKHHVKECDDLHYPNEPLHWYLKWYSTLCTDKGLSQIFTPSIDSSKYQYAVADWAQTEKAFGGQMVGFSLGKSSEYRLTKTGQFNYRTTSDPLIFKTASSKPLAYSGPIRVFAEDNTKGKCPRIQMHVFGIALMYREFKVSIVQPQGLNFTTPDGPRTIQPAEVKIANASSVTSEITVPFDTMLNFDVMPYTYGGNSAIRGHIKEYKISVDGKSFTWPATGSSPSLTFDLALVKEIDKIIDKVTLSGLGYTTKISIQPVFDYNSATVTVESSSYGKFKDTNLTPGVHKYHAGDILNFTPVANDGYYPSSYKLVYTTPTGAKKRDGDNYDFALNEVLEEGSYTARPEFGETANCIEIRMSEDAKSKLNILNQIPDSDLPQSLKGKIVLNVEPGIDTLHQIIVTPKPRSDGKTYRAKFYIPGYSVPVNGYELDYLARSRRADNVITIEAEEVNEQNYRYFELSGVLLYNDNPIRANGGQTQNIPATGVTVVAGSYPTYAAQKQKDGTYKKMQYIDRFGDSTGNDGSYTISGLKAIPGDVISIWINNGYLDHVKYYKLTTTGLAYLDRSFNQTVFDEQTMQTEEKRVDAKCYITNIGERIMPSESQVSARIVSLDYTFLLEKSNTTYGNSKSTLPIIQDNVRLTLNTTFDDSTQGIKRVEYYIRNDSSGILSKLTEVEATNKGQKIFEGDIYLEDNFAPGDLLYVRLIDANDQEMKISYVDENGNPAEEIINSERTYPMRFTGLSFFTPFVEPIRPDFILTGVDEPPIPIFDNLKLSSISTKLKITRDMGPSMDADGNFVEHPDYKDFVDFGYNYPFPPNSRTILDSVSKARNDVYSPSAQEQADDGIDQSIENIGQQVNNNGMSDKKMQDSAYKKSLNDIFKKPILSFSIMLGFAFQYKYDQSIDKYVWVGGAYTVGGTFGIQKSFYFVVYGVPLYANISGSMNASFEGIYSAMQGQTITADDTNEEYNISEAFLANTAFLWGFGGKVMPGIGICGVLGARGIMSLNLLTRVDTDKKTLNDVTPSDGFYFDFVGGIGVDLLLLSIELTVDVPLAASGVYSPNSSSASLNQFKSSGILRPYEPVNSVWTASGGFSPTAMPEEVKKTTLVENALERTKPQISTLADGSRLMVYLDNDGTHPINGQRLMYSVCSPGGIWSTPQIVSSAGYAAAYPKLYQVKDPSGKDVVCILWSEATKQFDPVPDSDAPDAEKVEYAADALQHLDIKCRTYIADVGGYELSSDSISVTDEALKPEGYKFMDINPQLAFAPDDGNMIIYYMKRDIGQAGQNLSGKSTEEMLTALAGVDTTYTTMAYRIYSNENWGEEKFVDVNIPGMTDPLILDFSVQTRNIDGEYIVFYTFTTDTDNDLTTLEDRDVYLGMYNLTTEEIFPAVNLTNDYLPNISPQLNILNNELVLTWVSDGYRLNMINIDDEFIGIIDSGEIQSNYKLSLYQFYSKLTTEGLSEQTSEFKQNENIEFSGLGNYKIVHGEDGNDYLFWTDIDVSSVSEAVQELYGATYIAGSEDEASGWGGAVKITDLNEILDEISVTVDDDLAMTVVGNMYTQKVEAGGKVVYSPNKLVAIEFAPTNSLEVNELRFNSTYPATGTETGILFELENTGLSTAKGYTVEVYSQKGGNTFPIETITSNEHILPGTKKEFQLPWTVSEDGLTIIVEVSEPGTDNKNSAIMEVPLGSELWFSNNDAIMTAIGQADVLTTITNIGNKATGDFTIEAVKISGDDADKSLGTFSVPSIAPGETRNIRENINVDFADLDRLASAMIALNPSDENIKIIGSTVVDLTVRRPVDIVVNGGSPITVGQGQILPLNSVVEPSAFFSSSDCVYSTEDSHIAIVTETGNLIGVGAGSTEVTISHLKSGVAKTAVVTVTGTVPPTPSPSPSNKTGGETGTAPSSADVISSPSFQDVGSQQKIETEGVIVDLYTVDDQRLTEVLDSLTGSTLTINVIPSENSETAQIVFTAAMLKEIADKNITLNVAGQGAIYSIPPDAFDLTGISSDTPIVITIKKEDMAFEGALTPPVTFTVTANGTEISTFKQYVKRILPIPNNINHSQVTTAVVAESGGTRRHVPTNVRMDQNSWAAEIFSLSNSTYALINSEKTFTDAQGQWYEAAVNEMGSREIISGVGGNLFAGGRDITRAEFAAIVIRALGLPADGNSSIFSDVPSTAWYSGAVGKASEYGIVAGIGNGQFAPDRSITRQEAMAMIQRAAKITGLSGTPGNIDAFSDVENVNEWAFDAAKFNVGSGLIVGFDGMLKPLDNITRAETATVILKLLQKSELVDVRTKF